MRRILLFLLLFGGGLALLLYFSEEKKQESKERVDAEQEQLVKAGRENDQPLDEQPELPPEPETDDEQTTKPKDDTPALSSITARGALQATVSEEGARRNRLYDFKFDDVQPSNNGYYDVVGILVNLYDPETDRVQTTLEAKEGVLQIDFADGNWRVGEEVKLLDAVVTLHEGSPMAPIKLFVPEVEGNLISRTYRSDSAVRVEGEGIFATGLGFIAEQANQRLVLVREGILRFEGDEGEEIELFAAQDGSIEFKRTELEDTLEKVEARLPKGGRLEAKGQERFSVEGKELTLNGRASLITPAPTEEDPQPKPKRVFHAEYSRIVQEVLFTHDRNRLTGGVAEVFFNAAGEVQRLELDERPVIEATLELASAQPGEPQQVEVRIEGEGPAVIVYNQESPLTEFDIPGPATITAPALDFELVAAEGMGGALWGRGIAHVMLRGKVDGKFKELAFDGSEVELRGSESDTQDRKLFLETLQPAHLKGTDTKGNPVDLRSVKDLKLRLDNEQLFIVLGREVTLELIDEGLWTVEVGELRNFDLQNGTFTAGEGVTYSGPFGGGTALRAVGHSRDRIEFFGDEESPATFDVDPESSRDLELGLMRARHIDVDKKRARAETQVELRFRGGDFDEEIDCEWFELRPIGVAKKGEPLLFEFEARQIKRALLRDQEGDTTIVADSVTGRGVFTDVEDGKTSVALDDFAASGSVIADYAGKLGSFRAQGDRILWKKEGGTRLEAPQGERVEARGRFDQEGLPYVLTATWIEYKDGELQALFPEITLDRAEALSQLLIGRSTTELHSGEAEWMTADESGLLLSGKAHFQGVTSEGDQLDLNASSIHLQRVAEGDERSGGVQELVAWDGFELKVGDDLVGRGEILQAGYETLRLEGRPARFEVQGFVWESDNIEYDVPNVLVRTDQGKIFGAPGSPWEAWQATYESLQPFDTADSTMMVMRSPTLRSGDREIRAEWATFWLDRQEWLKKTQEWLDGTTPSEEDIPFDPDPEEEQPEVRAPTIFGGFDTAQISEVLKEMYFEGEIVYSRNGKRIALMDAAYVDMVDGHGWIQNCELSVPTKIGRTRTDLIVRADWLRHSADGSLSADYAEVTACEFAEPHYFIRTKNLRLKPLDNESSVWDVLLKDNALIFDYGLKVPLPRVRYKSDEKGRPTFSGLGFGDSARYGTFVEASLDVDVGESFTDRVAKFMDLDVDDIDGNYRIKASYLDARGLLLDQRFRLTGADKFWMNVYLDGLYDAGEDRGIIKFKDESGDGFRWVLNTQSRYLLTGDEWIDLVYSTQSDPGVQAEFTESQFISYERRDTFLRWRKAKNEDYYYAGVRYRANAFRNDLERLPELGMVHGLTPFAKVFGQPLLYTTSTEAVYLRRREGTEALISPFDPLYDDGLGNREVLRGDTRHRVEAPFDLGIGGLRVSPYASFAGTAWSEGVDPSTSPTRGAVIAGAEVQSTLFRTWSHGVVNSVTPFAGYRGDLVSFDDDGDPLRLDQVDEPISGRYFDMGLRSRWRVPGGRRYLDASVRGTHADAVPDGEEEGWRPVRVLGELLARAEGVPFAIAHDALYDLDDGDTVLSFTSLSLLPHPQVGVEVAYNRGLANDRTRVFDAVSLGARWDATPKWQVEGRQSISQLDNAQLSSEVLLRRIGHDFVFELSVGSRSGEGGNSLTFKYRPLLGWRPPNFGSMQTLQRTRL